MWTILVVVGDELAEDQRQVVFIQPMRWSKHSRRSVPMTRSTTAFTYAFDYRQ